MHVFSAYRPHARGLLTLGLPLVGSHLAQVAIGVTDTVMMGWYGIEELAAVTLASTFFFVLFIFGSGFAWAVMPMVAAFDAEEDDTGIRRATRMGLWLSTAFFLLCLPLFWWSGTLLQALGQTPQVALDAQLYLRIAGVGLLPALGVMVFKSYLAALEHTRAVLWLTVLAAIINAVANYALIFGEWGAPELGIRGAALASVACQRASVSMKAETTTARGRTPMRAPKQPGPAQR